MIHTTGRLEPYCSRNKSSTILHKSREASDYPVQNNCDRLFSGRSEEVETESGYTLLTASNSKDLEIRDEFWGD